MKSRGTWDKGQHFGDIKYGSYKGVCMAKIDVLCGPDAMTMYLYGPDLMARYH
jgi:hypothetical protein